jgi:hypothetical protein
VLDPLEEQEGEADGGLGDADEVRRGRAVRHEHAQLARRRDVDLVHADERHDDEAEPRAGREDGARDGLEVGDEGDVRLAEGGDQLVLRPALPAGVIERAPDHHLVAGGAQGLELLHGAHGAGGEDAERSAVGHG